METKKLKKLRINKMDGFPVIGEQEQMALKGGDGYTLDEVSDMITAGTWTGGYVDGVGYVSGEATANGDGGVYWNSEGKYDMEGCPACSHGEASKAAPGDPKSGIYFGALIHHMASHREVYYGL